MGCSAKMTFKLGAWMSAFCFSAWMGPIRNTYIYKKYCWLIQAASDPPGTGPYPANQQNRGQVSPCPPPPHDWSDAPEAEHVFQATTFLRNHSWEFVLHETDFLFGHHIMFCWRGGQAGVWKWSDKTRSCSNRTFSRIDTYLKGTPCTSKHQKEQLFHISDW
jgi:hypothetical protein